MDVGALTPPLWGFEEREKLMVFYERASGARMHANYFRPGGVHAGSASRAASTTSTPGADHFLKVLRRHRGLLTDNRIFKQRNVDIGVVTPEQALAWGFSGVDAARLRRGVGPAQPALRMLRRLRVRYSGRAATATATTATSAHGGDAPIDQDHAPMRRAGEDAAGVRFRRSTTRSSPPRARRDEALDGSADPSFQALHRRLHVPAGEVYAAVEAPKGEFGVYLVSDGTNKPYRCKIRAPGFAHLQAMDLLCRGHMLADVSRDHRIARHRVRGDRPVSVRRVVVAERRSPRASPSRRERGVAANGRSPNIRRAARPSRRDARCCGSAQKQHDRLGAARRRSR